MSGCCRLKAETSFPGKQQDSLEQIAVCLDPHAAALELCKAFGDGKTQPASLCIPGSVAPDNIVIFLFGQFVRINGQFGAEIFFSSIRTNSFSSLFSSVRLTYTLVPFRAY